MGAGCLWPLLAAGLMLSVWHFSVHVDGEQGFSVAADGREGDGRAVSQACAVGRHWQIRCGRVAIGFGAAVVLGIPLGLTSGWYPAANQVVNPVMQILRPISPIAWIPVAIIFFGVGDQAAVFLIFLGAFFPIVVACVNGVSNVPAMYRRAGRNFGLAPAQLLARVVFPAALPQIIVGLRLALGIAWLVVVAAEMVAVDSGLGYLVIDSRNSGKRYDLVVAAMVMIGAIGLVLDVAFRRLEKIRSVRWGFRDES